jgi:hypothetical protein
MRSLYFSAFPVAAILSQIIPFDQTLPVLWNPVAQVEASQEITYQYVCMPLVTTLFINDIRFADSRNVSCEATINFQNSSFLPYTMHARPRQCAGNQNVHFQLPHSVPNGLIAVEWYMILPRKYALLNLFRQCSEATATAIDLMVVTGGGGDSEKLLRESQDAQIVVECRSNFTC